MASLEQLWCTLCQSSLKYTFDTLNAFISDIQEIQKAATYTSRLAVSPWVFQKSLKNKMEHKQNSQDILTWASPYTEHHAAKYITMYCKYSFMTCYFTCLFYNLAYLSRLCALYRTLYVFNSSVKIWSIYL